MSFMKELFVKTACDFSSPEETFGFTRSGKGIIRELLSSKASGNVVGIYSPVFGKGMFLTGVEDLYQEDKVTVAVLHRYDLSGQILSRNCIAVDEIEMVYSFGQRYKNPLLGEAIGTTSGKVKDMQTRASTPNQGTRGDILRYN